MRKNRRISDGEIIDEVARRIYELHGSDSTLGYSWEDIEGSYIGSNLRRTARMVLTEAGVIPEPEFSDKERLVAIYHTVRPRRLRGFKAVG